MWILENVNLFSHFYILHRDFSPNISFTRSIPSTYLKNILMEGPMSQFFLIYVLLLILYTKIEGGGHLVIVLQFVFLDYIKQKLNTK